MIVKRFASLTSRLVLITVALVATVSLLLALGTTLVLRSYLLNQLDDKVHGALERAAQADVFSQQGHGAPPLDPDGDGDVRGNGVGTLTARFAGASAAGQVIGGTVRSSPYLTPEQLNQLHDVPGNATPRTVTLEGLGHFRVAAIGDPANMIVAGLPTSEV